MIDSSLILCALCSLGVNEEQTTLQPMVTRAASELEPIIRRDADKSDMRLVSLAAAKVLTALALRDDLSDSVSEFRAGDVSVKKQETLKAACAEYERAYRAALPLLTDSRFYFTGVRVK